MRKLFVSAAFAAILICPAGLAQSTLDKAPTPPAKPLPPAKRGQPAFSFSGGKRVSVQTSTDGMREYSGTGSAPGTGIVEVGKGSSSSGLYEAAPAGAGTGINEVKAGQSGTGINEIGAVKGKSSGAKRGSNSAPARATSCKYLTKTGGDSLSMPPPAKPATTTVQTLGPDGKMQYTEVPVSPSTRKDPVITDVKDGEGKVKEFDWAKKGR